MPSRRRLASGLLLATALAAADSAAHGPAAARAAAEAGEIVRLESILAWIEARYEGRFVEAELEDERGQWVYEIEWRTPDGRVVELEFDARTGAPRDGSAHHGRHDR